MGRSLSKAERLQEMERLYFQRAYSDFEMAERMDVDRTTVFRDRVELETKVAFIEVEKGRWKIDCSKYLSKIRVNLNEALALYLSARRASQQTRIAQPHTASALEKLALALRQPMTDRLVRAADKILSQNAQPEQVKVLETITRSWVEGIKAYILYQGLQARKARNFLISPYLIEPSPWSDGTYLIGYSDMHGDVATFKVERIESAVLTAETFSIPEDLDEQILLQHAWGIWSNEEEPETVTLRFAPGIAARRLRESIWHPSQTITELENGGCLWTAKVAEWREMRPWIRGWGADCEVVGPERLRSELIKDARNIAKLYNITTEVEAPHNHLLRLWGKTSGGESPADEFHPALWHMLDVGHVARALLSEKVSSRWRRTIADLFGIDANTLVDWLPWFVALHDIGKISAAFQSQNPAQLLRLRKEGVSFGEKHWEGKPHHHLVSQYFIKNELTLNTPDTFSHVWQEAIAGHHGQFAIPESLADTRSQLRGEPLEWSAWRKESAEVLQTHLLKHIPDPWPTPVNISGAIMGLAGFTILCDWLGSDITHFPMCPDTPLDRYLLESTNRAYRIIEASGFTQKSQSDAPLEFTALFTNRIPPRPLQQAINNIPESTITQPCLALIEAPTGEGKTEAALALAHRIAAVNETDELYYALPTTATSNQMFGRVQRYLQDNLGLKAQVKLIHGQAFLYEDVLRLQVVGFDKSKPDQHAQEWFGPKKRALLAPFGVGTIDQIELAALNTRHNALRMIGLARKVVILDEVHAYDTYMTTIIERLLNWLAALGTSVILLSATLPKSRRMRLIRAYGLSVIEDSQSDAYPNLWIGSKAGVHHISPPAQQVERKIRLDIQTLNLSDNDVQAKGEWILSQIADGGCACWITNTVARAQKLFNVINRMTHPDVDRLLLHSQFPLDERQVLETQLSRKYGPPSNGSVRPSRGIVIGTQVLEQSLDLDFDLMVTDLAPVDLLLQRAGRLHRHDRPRPGNHNIPRLWVNCPIDGHGEPDLSVDKWVYAEFILRQTWLTLSKRDEIKLPDDYRVLVEAVYNASQPTADDPLRRAWDELKRNESNATGKARQRLTPEPDPADAFSGPAAQQIFEENENSAAWVVAQTRLSEQSLTIIPLEREGNVAWFDLGGKKTRVALDSPAKRETQLGMLRRSLRISNRDAIQALQSQQEPLPKLFLESTFLREAIPLWLKNGATILTTEKVTLLVTLDAHLGLVIDKQKGTA